MRGAVIAKVVASKSGKYEVGDYLYAGCGWREQAVVEEGDADVQVLRVPEGGRLTDALGVLGRLYHLMLCSNRSLRYCVYQTTKAHHAAYRRNDWLGE